MDEKDTWTERAQAELVIDRYIADWKHGRLKGTWYYQALIPESMRGEYFPLLQIEHGALSSVREQIGASPGDPLRNFRPWNVTVAGKRLWHLHEKSVQRALEVVLMHSLDAAGMLPSSGSEREEYFRAMGQLILLQDALTQPETCAHLIGGDQSSD